MSPARVCTGAEGLAGQPSEDTCTERFAAAIVKQLVAVIEVSVALVASQEKKFDIPLAACSVCTEGNAGTGCILPDDTCPLLIFRLPSTIFPGQEMDGKLGFERVEGSARRRGACFPLLASRGKTVRAGVHFVIAFLVSIWISLLISRASGMYPRHTPLEPTLQSPEWAGESASEPQMPHRKRAAIRYKNDKASQGLVGTTSPRAINFLGDNPRVSLLEQVPEAQADGGAVRESQASVFRDLASNFYRNWETPRDAEGRRHLALLALTVAAAQEEPRAQPGLLRLLDRAIAEDSAFFLDPVESDGYEQSGSGWRLLRREVLGSGSFNLVLAADVQTPEPEAQQVDSGVIASFQRLLGRFQRGRASIRRKLSGRRGKTGGAAEEPSERREGTTLLSVALRLPFISRRRRQNSDLDAGSLIRDRVRDHYLTKLFSTGVRTNELIETYGFAVPLFFGRARGMPDVLASDNRSLLLNFFEVQPRMVCDLSFLRAVANRSGLLFLLKRVMQLAAHLAAARIVHTDIKTENVLIDRTGQLYVSDFNMGRKAGDTVECSELRAPLFYDPDTVECILKTPGRRIPVTVALDTWSFGILLVEMACRELKLGGHSLEQASLIDGMHLLASLRSSPVRTASGGDNSSLVDWTECGDVPEEYKDTVGRMLVLDESTRLDPVEFYRTSPLFGAARLANLMATGGPAGQQRTR